MKYQVICMATIAMFMSGNLLAAVFVETFDASEDAYVDNVQINTNFNSDTLQIQGFNNDPFPGSDVASVQQSFLKFDVSSLEEKTVLGVYFGVFVSNHSSHTAPSLQLNYIGNDNWTEGSITWNNSRPLAGTAEVIGTGEQVDTDRYYEWILFKADSGFPNYWNNDHVTDGLASYMLTIGHEDFNNFAYFPSSENSANQPYLRIEYIPEPASVILLGLGTVLFRHKYRRN